MKTAVITAAGLGTRLLTFTKVAPKAMLPIYSKPFDSNDEPIMKPLIEHIFDNLYDLGFRKFCFIVNKISNLSIDKLETFNYKNTDPIEFINLWIKLLNKIYCSNKKMKQKINNNFKFLE